MQKFLLTLLFALLAVPFVSFAAFDDVTLTTDVVINVASINLSVSGSSAVVESLVAGASSFDVALQSGSSITVVSTDRRTFTLSPSSGVFTQSTDCTSSQSTLTLSGTGSVTVTVTPTSSTCTVASSGGGGGGGGGGSSAPYPTAPTGGFTATASTTNAQGKTILHFGFGNDITQIAISDNTNFAPATYINATSSIEWTATTTKMLYVKYCNKYGRCSNPISVQINAFASAPIAPIPAPIVSNSYKFYRNLAYRMTGLDVLELQKYLNAKGFVLTQSGVGSPGNETNYFGLLTEKAVQKFQAAHNVVIAGQPGYGLVGPRTRAKLNELSGQVEVSVNPPIKVTQSTVITRTLARGSSGEDIKVLQQILNSDPDTQITSAGAGSLGNETNYFGILTEKAVQKFQAKYDIVSSGTPQTTGYGLVGPKTRTKLNDLLSQ